MSQCYTCQRRKEGDPSLLKFFSPSLLSNDVSSSSSSLESDECSASILQDDVGNEPLHRVENAGHHCRTIDPQLQATLLKATILQVFNTLWVSRSFPGYPAPRIVSV